MKRIYILGCARSGTTLICHMMNCYKNIFVFENEVKVEAIRYYSGRDDAVVGKRNHIAYRNSVSEYDGLTLIYMVRHPYDVMTSRLFNNNFHVSPERWVSEADALQILLTSRPDTFVLKYEDLVADPDASQVLIGEIFQLTPALRFSAFHNLEVTSERRVLALRGLRAPDLNSVSRWRQTADLREYCERVSFAVGDRLQEFASRYGYDLSCDKASS
jgi:hypothetical protein